MFIFWHSLAITMFTLAAITSSLYMVTSLDTSKTATNFEDNDKNRANFEESAYNATDRLIPLKLECPREKNSRLVVQACKTSFFHRNVVGLSCDTVLSFRIGTLPVKICIKQSRLLLPDASIVFMSHKTRSYRLYQEEISSNIKSFFFGSLLISERFYPFHGNIHLSKLVGRTILFEELFIVECDDFNILETVNDCYQCKIFCPLPNADQDLMDLQKEKVFQSLPDGSIFHQYHQDFLEKQNRRKMKPKRRKVSQSMTCSLHLVADHIFFKFVGNKNFMKTINIMIEMVNKVNAIFKKNFNPQKGVADLNFAIGQITVYSSGRMKDYELNGAYMTADEYLKKFSLYDFSSMCLGVGFTFRNFGSVVGTAFPAFSNFNTPGGICDERVKINSHYVSYNTVIMSFYSPNKPSEETLALTLTHELGHSFGARHDETDDCLPGERVGNFIMSSMVNWGDKPNNYLFSKCSMLSIMSVVMKKKMCLVSVNLSPVCGNAIPEEGEECDCGYSNQCDMIDHCCTPADGKASKPCTLRRHKGKVCTPSISSCCDASCAYISQENKKMCNPVNTHAQRVTRSHSRNLCEHVRSSGSP